MVDDCQYEVLPVYFLLFAQHLVYFAGKIPGLLLSLRCVNHEHIDEEASSIKCTLGNKERITESAYGWQGKIETFESNFLLTLLSNYPINSITSTVIRRWRPNDYRIWHILGCVARIEKGGEVPVQQTVIRYDEYCCNRFRN